MVLVASNLESYLNDGLLVNKEIFESDGVEVK